LGKLTLGIDLACRADHRASLADEHGVLVWQQRRFRTTKDDLDALAREIGPEEELTVVLEPTRNAWVPVAAHFVAVGARVVVVPPEQAADLRRYYSKHTKTDGLDSRLLARLPLLHPDGLVSVDRLGPADALKRAVRRRTRLVDDRTASHQRIDALLELLGPGYAAAFGTGSYTKAALAVLSRYADPRALKRLGRNRLTALVSKASNGHLGEAKSAEMLTAADEALALWHGGQLDLDELAWDIASEVRIAQALEAEVERMETRIAELYERADPEGIMASIPGVGPILGAGILGRLGDARRFANLSGMRSFSGMVPGTDQSGTAEGHPGLTKSGDPGLRRDLYLAAEHARLIDPQLAAKYHRLVMQRGLHHTSALCHLSTTMLTRLGACWRRGERYVLRDVDGREISETQGRAIVTARYKIPEEIRRARRRTRKARQLRHGPSRRRKESTKVAPACDSTRTETSGGAIAS
jgi:transposase